MVTLAFMVINPVFMESLERVHDVHDSSLSYFPGIYLEQGVLLCIRLLSLQSV